MTNPPDLLPYYRARAAEYERVYAKPERQEDLGYLHRAIPEALADRRVLDVACGTGYWTHRIAAQARSVTGCDLAPETLTIAQAHQKPPSAARFVLGDAFRLDRISGDFDAAFIGFWWSHVCHADLEHFLIGLHRRLGSGARVLIVDNRYIEGSNSPITRIDEAGNTYQQRHLEDGRHFEILKKAPRYG